ncbi:MAG: glycosyltransferase family 9 protein [Nitrospirae bacterium]|nr:glycosyltransferase family 9 protein [Nitrospirota bacterium]
MNILLVRPDGIGDEILSIPVATELRRQMPNARLSFLSSDYAAPVLKNHPDIDEVLTITKKERMGELVSLFRNNVDTAIFLKPFRRLITAAWIARVPYRVGTGYRWYSCLLNKRVYEHRSDFSRHESEYNVRLLKGLGLSPGNVTPPILVITPEERAWAQDYLEGRKSSRILIHPGGYSSRPWKFSHFRDTVLRLTGEGYEVLLSGSKAEHDIFVSETGVESFPEGVRNLMGKLSLRQLMAVIKECDVVVSLATGPMHIAAALGIPTVSIFDPRRSNSPVRWKPIGRGIILRPDVPTCERCDYDKCVYRDCMDRISVETVIEKIKQVLSAAHPVEVKSCGSRRSRSYYKKGRGY